MGVSADLPNWFVRRVSASALRPSPAGQPRLLVTRTWPRPIEGSAADSCHVFDLGHLFDNLGTKAPNPSSVAAVVTACDDPANNETHLYVESNSTAAGGTKIEVARMTGAGTP
jgi:hypothetical protein